jgi:hypothetical protein
MYIQLSHRHYGVHKPIKHAEIDVDFNAIVLGDNHINESALIDAIPEEWLLSPIGLTLLTVADEHGSIGQSGLNHFLNWAKYFDAYVLELCKEPLSWWNGDQEG